MPRTGRRQWSSPHERRASGVPGVLTATRQPDGAIDLEFVPSRAQLRIFQVRARSDEELEKQLDSLGVPGGYRSKIRGVRVSWRKEITVLPKTAAMTKIIGH